MKKLPLLIFLFIFIFCGCTTVYKYPADKFSADFSAKYNSVNIRGKIISSSNKSMIIKIISPETMNGYSYEYKDNALSIKYKNYIIKTEPDYLPDTDFSKILFNTVKSIKKEDNLKLYNNYNSNLEYKGACESGEYTIISDKNSGYIKQISLKENKFKAIFNHIK